MAIVTHLKRRLRLIVSGLVGVAVGVLVSHRSPIASALVGWDAAALVYLARAWWIFVHAGPEKVRADASEEDESRGTILFLVVGAIAASFGAVGWALITATPSDTTIVTLAVATIVLSWILLHTVFALHYAHRHFEDAPADAHGDGLTFPGHDSLAYLDFVYLSFCVGMTFQVSDTDVTSRSMRNLVTLHAVLSYFFNTFILALTINIVGGMIGK